MTDYINCTFGVKQGDVSSPVLFSFFINELASEVIQNGRHGASFINDYFRNCLFCYWLMMLFCCQKRLLVYRHS